MKYIKNLSTIATATGLGALLATGITGCEDKQVIQEQPQKKGAFVIIEEIEKGKYKIKDEFPAEKTRIVLEKLDGTQKVLTKDELDALMKEEEAKIDAGTSPLTQPQEAQASNSGGMGLGSTILASVAGAMIGSYIGSKLFGNQNYQNNRRASYKSPSTFSRSKSSFSKVRRSSTKSSTRKKSGFFGSKKSSSRSGGFFGG